MGRNRRNSTALSSEIGRGCIGLLVASVCVGTSVTKIIMGAEYVDRCPQSDMIPVFVIISGCLPVLLSGLKQPYDGGHSRDKNRCRNTFVPIVGVIGIVVNLAWLVAGTNLVFGVWMHDDPFKENRCFTNYSAESNQTELDLNLTQSETNFNQSDTLTVVNISTISMANTNTSNINVSTPALGQNMDSMNIANAHMNTIAEKAKTNNRTFIVSLNGTDILLADQNGTLSDGRSECGDIFCDVTILTFAVVVVIIDWFIVICAFIYSCMLICRKLCVLKDEIGVNS